MDDWLWAFIQRQGLFLFEHIGWWIVIIWVLLWILIWRYTRIIISRLQQKMANFQMTHIQFDSLQFPQLVHLLSKRFDNTHLTGLPLTLAFSIFFALTILLLGIVEDVLERDFIVQFDHWVATTMAQAHTQSVVSVFHTITILGSPSVVIPLWVTILIILSIFKNYLLALPLFISLIGSTGMAALAKYGFARPRPIEALYIEHSASFPSAHATLAMSFYAVLFYLWWRRTSNWNIQVFITFLGTSFVLLLASSRIIIGVHYVSDVIAGLLLGGLWFTATISLYEWLYANKRI